jgi:hypothetical protein
MSKRAARGRNRSLRIDIRVEKQLEKQIAKRKRRGQTLPYASRLVVRSTAPRKVRGNCRASRRRSERRLLIAMGERRGGRRAV